MSRSYMIASLGLGLVASALLVYLIVSGSVSGLLDTWAAQRVITYALLLLAPLLIYLPISQSLGLRYFGLFAVISWALFGYLLAFVAPPLAEQANAVWYAIFLTLCFAVLTTIFTPIAYAIGYRFYSLKAHRRDIGRARRQAILLSLYIVAMLLLAAVSVLNPLNAILLGAATAVLEFFFLTRWDLANFQGCKNPFQGCKKPPAGVGGEMLKLSLCPGRLSYRKTNACCVCASSSTTQGGRLLLYTP